MSKVFITGIAGFLGSHLADYLLDQGHEVWGCDDLSSGDIDNVPRSALISILDISSSGWLALPSFMEGCDTVFHCAAAAHEGLSVFSPAFISDNIYSGSAAVFSAAIKAKVRRIVFCSSMARYGNGKPPFSEDSYPYPVDPYGCAKLGAEHLLEILSKAHGVEYTIAVPHNIYGPRQNYWTPYRNVAAIMMNRMLQGKQPIIYGDGLQQRSFSYVYDIVPALAKMATIDAPEIINIGPGDEQRISIVSLAEAIADILEMPFDPIFMPPRPCEVKHATCTCDKARAILGMEFQTSLRDGLKAMAAWMRERGPREFVYDLQIELPGAPKTWTDRLI